MNDILLSRRKQIKPFISYFNLLNFKLITSIIHASSFYGVSTYNITKLS
jgi:hypothetical protein